jgi:hypothetical protein
MASPSLDFLEVAHRLPGRVRVRIPALRRRADDVERVARHAADLSGVLEVEGHPFTASLVVRFDPARVAEERVVAALRQAAGVGAVLQPGEPRPAPPPRASEPASAAGRATVEAFRALDDELIRISGGGMDLGTLVTLGFFGAGALEVAVTGKIPAPPWFQLAWWGFRTFMTVEAAAVRDGASRTAALDPAATRTS